MWLVLLMSSLNYMKDMKNNNLLEYLKKKEGYMRKVKSCPRGVPTIGYGHAVAHLPKEFHKIFYISKKQAEDVLIDDVNKVFKQLKKVYPESTRLQRHRQEALVSLIFNWGIGNFAKSKLLKNLKIGDMYGAADEFLDINKCNGRKMKGLTNRRKEEYKIFISGWQSL